MSTVPMKTVRRPFLTARWSNLAILTWEVPPALLEPHLPAGLELDRRDGAAFASLVAFDFLDTRVLGIPWPGFTRFPEVNLRFYARRGERRGVVFIREFVPLAMVAWLARALYHEPYLVAPIQSDAGVETGAMVTARRRGRTRAFRVRHAVWDVYPVRSWSLDFDAEVVYGPGWRMLSAEKPVSVVLAAGSAVSVYSAERL